MMYSGSDKMPIRFLIFSVCSSERHIANTTGAVNCSFFGMSQARWALNCFRSLTQLVQLIFPISLIVRLEASLKMFDFSFLLQIMDDGFGAISILQLVNLRP